MDHIDFLIDLINEIELKHRNNECYYHLDHNLCEYYNWTLPPEYKRALFSDENTGWTKCSDMYYLMVKFYEHVTGNPPGVNFQLNDIAVKKLMGCLNTAADDEKKAVVFLFVKCTSVSESRRIKNASELMNTEAFKYLIKNNQNSN